jgi:oligopeptide/dipeptide ABC transporter ATP-binding protein
MTLALRKAEDVVLDAAAPAAAVETAPLLKVRNLTLKRGPHVVLDNVCLDLHRADTLALVGESGAGKSTLAYALIGLLRPPEVTITGAIHFDGTDLTTLREKEWQPIRGNRIGLVFQDATAALNPCFTVGAQIAEPLKRHIGLSSRDARTRAIELLDSVGIADPERRLSAYPHELSGGMQQRVMIATALACGPELLLADEPTSALDVTIQAQIMALILARARDAGTSAIFVLHDLALASQVCRRVAVLYAGQIVETGPAAEVLEAPRHPYTRGLRSCVVELGSRQLEPIAGSIPAIDEMPSGCRFSPRCPLAQDICRRERPPLEPREDGREVACWFA